MRIAAAGLGHIDLQLLAGGTIVGEALLLKEPAFAVLCVLGVLCG
jgi:hypothetical protein